MNRLCRILAVPAATLFILAASAQADDPPAEPAIDPGAMEALNQMGTFLRALGPFRVESSTTRETVLEDGYAYQQCGNTWYQPQMSGSSTTYIVVNNPGY